MTIDHRKLLQLQRDHEDARALLFGLSNRYQQGRDELMIDAAQFVPARTALHLFPPGVDPVISLAKLKPAEREAFPREVAAAQAIADAKTAQRELYAHIEQMQVRADALQSLVRACEAYAKEQV